MGFKPRCRHLGSDCWGWLVKLVGRSDIWLIDFDPVRPNEVNAKRPAVVVTNNIANTNGTTLTVIPLTTEVTRVYSFQVLLQASATGLDFDSKAQIEQIRAVSTSRFIKRFGQVPTELMQEIDSRIREHLQL